MKIQDQVRYAIVILMTLVGIALFFISIYVYSGGR